MKTIPLTQGKVALVDDDDYAALSQVKWCAHEEGPRWYAVRRTCGKIVRMHRAILVGSPTVDHINGDGLDNRRCNLRATSRSLNALNRFRQANNVSGRIGVHFREERNKWMAYISIEGKRQSKHFDSFDDAVAWRKDKENK